MFVEKCWLRVMLLKYRDLYALFVVLMCNPVKLPDSGAQTKDEIMVMFRRVEDTGRGGRLAALVVVAL